MNTPRDHLRDPIDPTPPDDTVRAGEYVLGVLDREERAQAQARIAREPEFAVLVARWEDEFAPWTTRVAPVMPSASVWPRIRTQLGWSPETTLRRGPWNSIGFWRAATAVALAAGIAAIAISLRPRPIPAPVQLPPRIVVQPAPAPAPNPVTVLARDDGSTGWIASIDAANGRLLLVPVPSPADAQGRVHELWIIPAGQAPVSLGRLSNQTSQTVVVPTAVRKDIAVGATLAVTLEPAVGMPHAAPTGPIVAKGGIDRI